MSSENLNTRNRILDSACRLLLSGQGSAIRMSDIAKEAGISRQAVYLHFPKRAELLIAATQYLDELNDVDARLKASRNASSGLARMDAYIDAWANYIPEIYGLAKALLAMRDTDEAADLAWKDRMQAMRHGCRAAVIALKKEGKLAPDLTTKQATDLLWTMLSVRNWEQLTMECDLTPTQYITTMKRMARRTLLEQ